MTIVSMNFKNSKTSSAYSIVLNLIDKMNLQRKSMNPRGNIRVA